jgi:phytoene synthase
MSSAVLSPSEITARSKSNFSLSFLFLPKAQQEGITSFYAFSRVVDDAVDDHGPEQGAELIEFWKTEVRLAYEGTPTHPVTLELQKTIQRFQIPRRYLDLLVEGCTWDLNKTRYQSYDELYQYCYRVAGCIGLTCMKIFGQSGEAAEQAAEELGVALQLTNILRDVGEDAKRGRLYLPLEDLNLYRLSEADVLSGTMGPKYFLLMKLMSERAEVLYNRAFTKMEQMPRRPLIAAWIMGRVYFALLQKIKSSQFNVFEKKIRIPKIQKSMIALGEWARGWKHGN